MGMGGRGEDVRLLCFNSRSHRVPCSYICTVFEAPP